MPMFSFQPDAFIGWATIRRLARTVGGVVLFAALIAVANPPMFVEVTLVAIVGLHVLLRLREVSAMAVWDIVVPDYPPLD